MKEYIRFTLADLRGKIASLERLCSDIEKEFQDAPKGSGERLDDAIKRNGNAAAARKQAKVAISANGRPTGAGNNAERIIQVAAGLAEPLMITAMATAAGIAKSSAKSSFDRWLKRGWLVKVAYGEYKRTKAFGKMNTAPASSPAPAPRAMTAIPDVKKKLEEALKQRDQARLAGRDAVERIYQEEINKLEAQLAS